LNLFSLIINSETNLVPDLLFIIHHIITYELLQESGNLRHPHFAQYLKNNTGSFEPKEYVMLQILKSICEEKPIVDPKVQPAQPVAQSFFELFANKLVLHIQRILVEFPLIQRTPLLQRAIDLKQPINIQENSVVVNLDELLQLVKELLNAKFHDLFHKILMHKKIDITYFQAEVEKITKIAEQLSNELAEKNSTAAISVVVFVDEFNTTSMMGVMKEVVGNNANVRTNLFIGIHGSYSKW
jgi:hypothetical protein